MKIEERLCESEKNSYNSSLLWAQWCFDKQVLSRSLNVISTIFPHYSLHESTHSNAIILEIEKILGSTIGQLSFVDSWLLLEAAYWHDIGMIVTDEEKKSVFETSDFNDFIKQLSLSSSDLSQYANNYIEFKTGKITTSIIEYEKSFTFLLAEYIRKTHPERSKFVLQNPDKFGINTPQTGLINFRLFNILGDIIESHGKSFDSILSLPFENDGLEAGDVAHPRFVASLLRLGDLLDLEDGRHCPTQIKTIGKIPALSFAHLEKHRSIVSKTISEFIIDIKARCLSYESFELQNDWFAFIEQEVENQDKFWGEIAPNYYLRKLPSIKSLTCDLEGSVSFENRTSRLEIDPNRIYDFLNGKYIYENTLSCIHEILQNAVDATIDRIWLEKKDSVLAINDFRKITDNYQIMVQVNTGQLSNGKVQYQVVISDKGKGMSLVDIKSILIIASEKNQHLKESLRQGMPEWMKPSGFFGIGLQSVFSLTNELFIKTKSAGDDEYEIIIKTATGKLPSFVVKKKKNNSWDFGTTVSFAIFDDAIPLRLSGRSVIFNSLAKFDPLTDSVLNATKSQIEDEVSSFAQYCEFPINFDNIQMENYRNEFQIVDLKNGIEYMLEFMLEARHYDWSFRGRPFKTNQRFKYLNIVGNIISERADTFLPLNREKLHQSGEDTLKIKVQNSILEMKNEILALVKNKEIASLYYFLYEKEIDKTWKDIKLNNHNISSLIEIDNEIDISFDLRDFDTFDNNSSNTLITNSNSYADVFRDILIKLNYGIIINKIEEKESCDRHSSFKRMVIIYNIKIVGDKSLSSIGNEAISFLSNKKLSNVRSRYWLPCGEMQMQNISISSDNNYLWLIPLTHFSEFFQHGILLKSTKKSLEQDIAILISAIKKDKPELSEIEIEKALKKFYMDYPFECIENKHSVFE